MEGGINSLKQPVKQLNNGAKILLFVLNAQKIKLFLIRLSRNSCLKLKKKIL